MSAQQPLCSLNPPESVLEASCAVASGTASETSGSPFASSLLEATARALPSPLGSGAHPFRTAKRGAHIKSFEYARHSETFRAMFIQVAQATSIRSCLAPGALRA